MSQTLLCVRAARFIPWFIAGALVIARSAGAQPDPFPSIHISCDGATLFGSPVNVSYVIDRPVAANCTSGVHAWYVVMYYSIDNGQTWIFNGCFGEIPNLSGSFDWDPPHPGAFLLKASIQWCLGCFFESNTCALSVTCPPADFRIASPVADGVLIAGHSTTIRWSSAGPVGTTVSLDITIDKGQSWTALTEPTPNDGEFTCLVPQTPTTSAYVRIRGIDTCTNAPISVISGRFAIATTCDDGDPATLDIVMGDSGLCVSQTVEPWPECTGDADCSYVCQECVEGSCMWLFPLCNDTPKPCELMVIDCVNDECHVFPMCPPGFCCNDAGLCEPCDDAEAQQQISAHFFTGLAHAATDLAQDIIRLIPVGLPARAAAVARVATLLPSARLAVVLVRLSNVNVPATIGIWVNNVRLAARQLSFQRGGADEWIPIVFRIDQFAGQEVQVAYVVTADKPLAEGAMVEFGPLRVFSGEVPSFCPGDADGDRDVDFADVTKMLTHWAATYSGYNGEGDANGDRAVTFADVTSALTHWGMGCSASRSE